MLGICLWILKNVFASKHSSMLNECVAFIKRGRNDFVCCCCCCCQFFKLLCGTYIYWIELVYKMDLYSKIASNWSYNFLWILCQCQRFISCRCQTIFAHSVPFEIKNVINCRCFVRVFPIRFWLTVDYWLCFNNKFT